MISVIDRKILFLGERALPYLRPWVIWSSDPKRVPPLKDADGGGLFWLGLQIYDTLLVRETEM